MSETEEIGAERAISDWVYTAWGHYGSSVFDAGKATLTLNMLARELRRTVQPTPELALAARKLVAALADEYDRVLEMEREAESKQNELLREQPAEAYATKGGKKKRFGSPRHAGFG